MRDRVAEIKARHTIHSILSANGVEVKGGKFCCPFHDDKNPSGSVYDNGKRAKCFAGCFSGDVIDLQAMFDGKTVSECLKGNPEPSNGHRPIATPGRIVVIYSYKDAIGKELYQAVRFEPKDFRPRHNVGGKWHWGLQGVERVLYRLPEIMSAPQVWICEGEKDADTFASCGIVATTCIGGANGWGDSYAETLRGKDVVLCGDNDEPGEKYILTVLASVLPVAKSVRKVRVPAPYKDVSDLVASVGPIEAWAQLGVALLSAPLELMETASDGIIRKSLLELYQEPPNETDTLLGNRWLCRRACLLLVAPTGVGKSSGSAQMDVCWTAGKPAFGITPAGPLRILTIQVENDAGDLHEMVQGVVFGMHLDEAEIAALGSNNRVVTMPGKMGKEFAQALDRELEAFPCDILRIDPVTGFFGGDVKDSQSVNQFCREWLQPLLDKHNCGLILVLHTPKTNHRDTSNWKDHDWMYAGAGAADWSNFARAILIIEPLDYPVFEFKATKRKQRIGWVDSDGRPVSQQFWAHSTKPGAIFWEPATADQQQNCNATEKTKHTLLALVPDEGSIEKKALVSKAGSAGIGQVKAKGFLAELIQDGNLEEVAVPRKGTRAEAHVQRPRR